MATFQCVYAILRLHSALAQLEISTHILDSEHCITQPQDCTNSQFVWNIWPERAEDIQKKFLMLGRSMLSCTNRQSCTHHSSIKCSNYRLLHILLRFSIEYLDVKIQSDKHWHGDWYVGQRLIVPVHIWNWEESWTRSPVVQFHSIWSN